MMKIIRSCLSALLMLSGMGSAALLSLGVGGCGGADTSGVLVDGSDHTTTPAGAGSESTTGGATTGDDILPSGDTTGGSATAGDTTGGDATGGATTAGDTTGGDTAGGDTTGTTTGILAEPVKATLLSDIQLADSDTNVIFKITFDGPIDFASVTSKKSIVLTSDAKVVAGALAALFTLGAVDPIDVGTIPATYLSADNNHTVFLVANPSDVKTFRVKDSEGNWQPQPYHLIVFGADTNPPGYRARAVVDAQGIAIPNESRKQYDCGSGKGKIPCGENVDIGTESRK